MSARTEPESFLALAGRRLPRLRERAEYLQARIREKEDEGFAVGYLKADLSAILWAISELAEKQERLRALAADKRVQTEKRFRVSESQVSAAVVRPDVYLNFLIGRALVELRGAVFSQLRPDGEWEVVLRYTDPHEERA